MLAGHMSRWGIEKVSIDLRCAVEAKILDTKGTLDLPSDLEGIDAIYAADYRVPSFEGPLNPRTVREEIESAPSM